MKIYKGFILINYDLVCICKSNNFAYIDKKINTACFMLNCIGLISSMKGFKWYGK